MDDSSTPTYISVAEKGDAASANKSKKDSNISKSIEDHPVEHQELEISYTRSVDNVPTSDSETRRFIEALLVKILVQRPEPDVLEQMANALDERFPKRWEEAMAFRLYTGSMMNLCLALPALAPRVFRATLRGLVDVDAWIVEKAEDGEDVAPAAAVVSGQVVPTGVVPSTVGPVDNRAVALADACAANKTSEAADDGGKSVASTAPTETADNKRDETSEENVNKVSQKLDCAMVVVFEFLAKFFDLTSHHPKLTSEVKCRSASMALADAARGGSDVSTASRVRSATTSASSTSTATTTTTSANQINKFSLAALKEDHSLPEHKVAFLESLLQEFQDNFLQQQAKLENCNGILDTLYGGDTTALTPNGDKCSKNVQYIYFYLCCLHPRFCEEFLCRLLQTFYGQPTSSNYKKRSASTNSVVLPAAVSIEENNNNGRNTTTNNDVDARRAASTGATGASTISTPRRSPASFSIGVPFTHRKAAVQYLASILVRAKFLSTQYAVKAIGYIVEWCVSMLPVIEKRLLPNRKTDAKDLNASSSSSAAIRDNTFCEVKDPESELFHHAVQSICYILCFKVQKLLQEKDASLYAPTGANKRRMSTARNRSSCGSNYGKQEVQLGEQGSSSKPTNKNSNVLEEIFFSVTEPNLSSILLSPLRPLRRLEHHTCDEFERRMRNNLGDRLDHIWSHSFGTTTTSTTTNTDKNEEAATSSSSFPERDPYHIYRISQCLFPFEEYRLRNSKCMIARLWTDYSETKPEWENEMEHEREMAASGMQPGGEDEGDHSDGCGGSASGGSGQQHLLNAPNTSIVNIKMEFDEDVTHESLDLQLQQQQRLRSSLKKGPRRGFESAEEDENAAKKKRRRVHFAPNLEESISIPNNEMLKEQKDALKKGKNGDNSSERKNDQMKALEKAAGNGDNIKNSEVDSGGSDDEDNAEDDRYADPEESREDSFLPSSAFSPDLSAFGSVMDRLSAGGAARDEGEGAGNYLYHITSSASTQGREDEDEVVVVGTAGEDEHEAFPEMIEDHDVHNNLHQVSSDEEMSDE
ncbi:unnamed protein product [Amoebophrya sp. A25]|nr:unnamed protein product [Amoebophrya sp. A25]|eukprot:GSA25T00004034001.1